MSSSTDEQLRAARESLKKLDVKRKSLESEAAAIVDELMTPPADGGGDPMGVDTPLTDADGYPRADIDVFRARTLRHRLNEIRTDHKELMKQVEAGMAKCAAFSKHNKDEDEEERKKRQAPKPKPKFDPKTGKWVVANWDGTVSGVDHGEERTFDRIGMSDDVLPDASRDGVEAAASQAPSTQQPLVPFAIIDGVAPDSPASEAGLHENDLILQFGSVHHLNHRDLKGVLEVVPTAAANQEEVAVTVLRSVEQAEASAGINKRRMIVKIRPRPWAGRGLLGCHIKAYDDTQLDEPGE